MMKAIIFLLLFLPALSYGQEIPIFRLEAAPGPGYFGLTDTSNFQEYVTLDSFIGPIVDTLGVHRIELDSLQQQIDDLPGSIPQVLSKVGANINLSGGGGSVTLLDDNPNNELNYLGFTSNNIQMLDASFNILQDFSKNNLGWWQKNTSTNEVTYATANVGIGNTDPTQTLHVTGTARLTGHFFDVSNNSGTNGQVLVRTSTGPQWQAPAGGSKWTDSGANIYRSSRVGIQNTSPQTNLHVAGAGEIVRIESPPLNSAFLAFRSNTNLWSVGITSGNVFQIVDDATPKISITSTGSIATDGRLVPTWTGLTDEGDVSGTDQIKYDYYRTTHNGEVRQRYANQVNTKTLNGSPQVSTLLLTDEYVFLSGFGSSGTPHTITLPTTGDSEKTRGKVYCLCRAVSSHVTITNALSGYGAGTFVMNPTNKISCATFVRMGSTYYNTSNSYFP